VNGYISGVHSSHGKCHLLECVVQRESSITTLTHRYKSLQGSFRFPHLHQVKPSYLTVQHITENIETSITRVCQELQQVQHRLWRGAHFIPSVVPYQSLLQAPIDPYIVLGVAHRVQSSVHYQVSNRPLTVTTGALRP
jgi:hypothetical protein